MKISNLIVSIPHASTYIPPELRRLIIRSDEELLQEPDLYTERIYKIEEANIIEATVNRVISDVNRAPDEIYTKGRLRAQGVIMLTQSHGNNVFKTDPPIKTMEKWIAAYHDPFHKKLQRLKKDAGFIIDGHSMWSRAPSSKLNAGEKRPDVNLGNRFYTTCDAKTTQFFRDYFEKLGYDVAINYPYSGRYVIGTHCSRLGVPGIQVEINRSLYMNEETLAPDDSAVSRLYQEFLELVKRFCKWYKKPKPDHEMTDLSIAPNIEEEKPAA